MIVAGFGFRQAASVDSLLDALNKACGTQAPGLLATAEDKATAPAFQALSDHLHLPVRAIAQDVLAQVETPTRSATVRALRGSGSVAEAAALVAWLCSEDCSFTTGAVFDLSGGRATY